MSNEPCLIHRVFIVFIIAKLLQKYNWPHIKNNYSYINRVTIISNVWSSGMLHRPNFGEVGFMLWVVVRRIATNQPWNTGVLL